MGLFGNLFGGKPADASVLSAVEQDVPAPDLATQLSTLARTLDAYAAQRQNVDAEDATAAAALELAKKLRERSTNVHLLKRTELAQNAEMLTALLTPVLQDAAWVAMMQKQPMPEGADQQRDRNTLITSRTYQLKMADDQILKNMQGMFDILK